MFGSHRPIRNRLLLAAAIAVAGALVATPTVVGLSGNTSFSQDIQVPVPSGAREVNLHEIGPSASSPRHESELGEDRPGSGEPERSDHHSGEDRHDVASGSATDDHGGRRGAPQSGPTDRHGSGGGSRGADDHRGDDHSADSGRGRG